MAENKDLGREIDRLSARIEKIEARMGGLGIAEQHGVQPHYCAMPRVPEREFAGDVSEHRERLLRYLNRKWVNGTKLRFAFFPSGPWSGPESEKGLVREGFDVWSNLGIGITFQEVSSISEAEIRIGFLQSGRTWSYVGRDVIDIPGQQERTMNYGWSIEQDPRGVDVAVHEIGHTLGFPHEHQNPFAGIVWDEEAVYRYFAQQGWDRDDTDHNVLRKLQPAEVEGTDWDPNSIMHYGFPAGLILQPAEYRDGIDPQLGLSESDRNEVRKFYPPIDDAAHPTLEPFRLETLNIGPGEQANFIIEPRETREYTIQTFGSADTLLVLFEDQGGDTRFMAGDDDSGTSLNAKIQTRLYPNRRYILRVRLYLNWASAQTALMMW
jgi:hypothetical protein